MPSGLAPFALISRKRVSGVDRPARACVLHRAKRYASRSVLIEDTDEVDGSRAISDRRRHRRVVLDLAYHPRATVRMPDLAFAARPHEQSRLVSCGNQHVDQVTADKAGAAGHARDRNA
jgi:hypothetical protein